MEVCVVDVDFIALGHHMPPHTAHAALSKPQQANGVCISKPQRSQGRLLNLSSYNSVGTCAGHLGVLQDCAIGVWCHQCSQGLTCFQQP